MRIRAFLVSYRTITYYSERTISDFFRFITQQKKLEQNKKTSEKRGNYVKKSPIFIECNLYDDTLRYIISSGVRLVQNKS